MPAALLLALSLSLIAQAPADDASKPPELVVKVDTTEVPEVEPWAREAAGLVREWYPRIEAMLRTDGFTPPREVTLRFKKDMDGVAYASRNTITIASDWIKKHPDDKGMVVHELTHVIQQYPRSRTKDGWLVEGIADYVRFLHFEPQTKIRIGNPEKASYRDSYRTTAKFLGWVEQAHDKQIVARLNRALRKGEDAKPQFQEGTSMSLDDLWDEFMAANGKKKPATAVQKAG